MGLVNNLLYFTLILLEFSLLGSPCSSTKLKSLFLRSVWYCLEFHNNILMTWSLLTDLIFELDITKNAKCLRIIKILII